MNKIFAIGWYNDPEDFGVAGVYETKEAAEADIPRLDKEWENERAHVVEEWEITKPLDPEPWENYSQGRIRAVTPPEAPYLEGWRFDPRQGFTRDSASYAVRGGLDPLPWKTPAPEGMQIKGRTRWEWEHEGYPRTPNVFDPREGFDQNREHYA
jgi:hypothetical protein